MKKFETFTGIAAPLDLQNIDTDMIIPKQFLKTIKRTGLGKHLFDEMRYDDQGAEKPDFILNRPPYRQAEILIAGANFGCGSSREHAPWALADFGIRVIISESFADIFHNNCFKNGLLPIALPAETVEMLMQQAQQGVAMTVDLGTQKITLAGGDQIAFSLEPFHRTVLLEGLDDIALTLAREEKIAAYEALRRRERPWL